VLTGPQTGTLTCDVVVVGSGAGALTGAYLAAAGGLDTVVLEKTDLLGGTSAYSGASCWLPGSQVQERADLGDSVDDARRYLAALLPEADHDRVEAFLTTAPEVVARLEEDPALTFAWQAFPDYFDAPGRQPVGRSIVPLPLQPDELGDLVEAVRPPVHRDRKGRGHTEGPLTGGGALIGRLLLALRGTGRAQVLRETPLQRLVVEDGRVVGVVATSPAGELEIRARRGVLLAAGGFESDAELRQQHGVPGSARWSMSPDGANTGDALRAAVAVGAATDLLGEAWFCPSVEQPDGSAAFMLGFRGGLLVDQRGQRFANESLPYDRMGREMAADPDARVPSFLLFDASEGGQVPAIALPTARLEDHLEAGTWVSADDLGSLADQLGIPSDELAATVERFNASADAGVDEDFHRGEDPYDRYFATRKDLPNPCLVPLRQPPYYAARVVLGDLGTKGGLRVDADGRVLREDGSAIDGLFATSNTVASLSRDRYPGPGVPLGTAMVTAYRAVRAVTAEDAALLGT
jgi:succinate dehydrogenase/fumarate reductase flavoprotein subunit